MKKFLYIIPAWQDICADEPYRRLAKAAQEKGYEVTCIAVDWTKPLSTQVFTVPEKATIFGFSLGAILARLIAQKHPCEHLILASMTPDYNFTDPKIRQDFIDLTGKEFFDDMVNNLKLTHQARRQTILYGELEKEPADIVVPGTEHELNNNYIQKVVKVL